MAPSDANRSRPGRPWPPTCETGARGERAAAEYLRAAGYEICAMNWRQGRYELDIVARKAGLLHVVEVKTRRRGSLTPPEAAITSRKFRALHRATSCYLQTTGEEAEVQFDLAAVEMAPDGTTEVRLIEHAMEYNW
ncbi:MAG: YraN family protein [Alistipes sp.]|nr:YraN family protein [Alistipes sp.]